jgi:cytochrome c oxidase subunit IV
MTLIDARITKLRRQIIGKRQEEDTCEVNYSCSVNAVIRLKFLSYSSLQRLFFFLAQGFRFTLSVMLSQNLKYETLIVILFISDTKEKQTLLYYVQNIPFCNTDFIVINVFSLGYKYFSVRLWGGI